MSTELPIRTRPHRRNRRSVRARCWFSRAVCRGTTGCSRRRRASLRAQKPGGDLRPRLRAGIVDQPIALGHGSEAAAATSETSNSMLACGIGMSVGRSAMPKQAFAASDSGQRPKCLVPSSLWVNRSSPSSPSKDSPRRPGRTIELRQHLARSGRCSLNWTFVLPPPSASSLSLFLYTRRWQPARVRIQNCRPAPLPEQPRIRGICAAWPCARPMAASRELSSVSGHRRDPLAPVARARRYLTVG